MSDDQNQFWVCLEFYARTEWDVACWPLFISCLGEEHQPERQARVIWWCFDGPTSPLCAVRSSSDHRIRARAFARNVDMQKPRGTGHCAIWAKKAARRWGTSFFCRVWMILKGSGSRSWWPLRKCQVYFMFQPGGGKPLSEISKLILCLCPYRSSD